MVRLDAQLRLAEPGAGETRPGPDAVFTPFDRPHDRLVPQGSRYSRRSLLRASLVCAADVLPSAVAHAWHPRRVAGDGQLLRALPAEDGHRNPGDRRRLLRSPCPLLRTTSLGRRIRAPDRAAGDAQGRHHIVRARPRHQSISANVGRGVDGPDRRCRRGGPLLRWLELARYPARINPDRRGSHPRQVDRRHRALLSTGVRGLCRYGRSSDPQVRP